MEMSNSYIGGLDYYSKNSNEDEAVAQSFLKQYTEGFGLSGMRILNWLDVGSGNGRKLLMILRGFYAEFEEGNSGVYEDGFQDGLLRRHFTDINLDIVEPNGNSIETLGSRFRYEKLDGFLRDRFQNTWEQFSGDRKYDLITFFHSVYGIDLESLARIPDFLTEDGIACIVVEAYDSAINRTKRSLSSHLSRPELMLNIGKIRQFLHERGIRYSESFGGTGQGRTPLEQRFYIDGIDDDFEALSSLFLSKPEDQGKEVPNELLEKFRDELRKYSRKERTGRTYVSVPDGFIWVHKK